jgi:hypothetical protein
MNSNNRMYISEEELNSLLPISLVHIEHIIDKLSRHYPIIDKHKIVLIVRTLLNSMRYFLINGYIISINNIFPHMKLINYGNSKSFLKVKISTPISFKNGKK